MTNDRIPSFACFLLLTAVLLGGTAPGSRLHAAEAESGSSPPVATAQDEIPTAADHGDAPDTESIQSRIRQLEAASDTQEPQKAKLLEIYRQILEREESAKVNAEKAESFRRAIESAPAEIQRIRQQISGIDSAAKAPAETLPAEQMTAEGVQLLLIQEQAVLTDLKARHADLEKRLHSEEDRPAKARVQLGEAQSVLAQIEQELASAPASDESATEADRAHRALLLSRQKARAAEISMLEQELLSHPARVDLLTARRDLLARQISVSEDKVHALEAMASKLRQAESDRARMEADRRRREALGKHELIQALANENAEITRETQELGPLIDRTRQNRTEAETQLEQVKSDLEETRRTLELGNITETVGAVLLEQRRSLRTRRELQLTIERTTEEKALAQLRLFKIDRQLKQLADLPGALQQTMAQVDTTSLPDDYIDELTREVSSMLATKREHLGKLAQSYRAYVLELNQHEAVFEDLANLSGQLIQILDENLLWIRNAPALGMSTLLDLDDSVHSLLRPQPWADLLNEILADLRSNIAAYLIFALLLIAAISSRPRLNKVLESLATRVGKTRVDHIGVTVRAALATILIAAPFAALLLLGGLRLSAMHSDFAGPLSAAAISTGITFFFLRGVRAICRRNGLGEKHFNWNPDDLRLIRRHLQWFLPLATALTFLIAFTESLGDPAYTHALGRLGYIAQMAGAMVFSVFLFHPKRGLAFSAKEGAMTWASRTRPLWRPVAIVVLLGLSVVAGMGYNYMALALYHRLNQTIVLLFGAAVIYAFLHRWLMISQHRLATKLRLEKWENERKSREENPEDDAEINLVDLHADIDVAEVRSQTVELLRMATALVLLVGFWLVWADVLPAFRILDRVTLWTHTVTVDGEETIRAITLTNLAMCLAILGITIIAARNLPGFLEIAVLQRLPVDQGARYATSTLTLYFIVTVGAMLAFMSIGIGWSSVQWLVAALTVGLGFGLQEIFGNFVSGLIILIERPIRVGDTVTVGSISGVVSRIRMRATTITDWNRKELVVPNKNFITGELINWSLSDPMLRLDFIVGIAYGSDTTLAQQTMLKVCREHPLVMDQPEPTVFFTGFGDNSLNFEVRVFVAETTNTARTRIVHDLHMAIDRAFRDLDICIAFPQRDVHLDTVRPLDVRVITTANPSEAGRTKSASGEGTTRDPG